MKRKIGWDNDVEETWKEKWDMYKFYWTEVDWEEGVFITLYYLIITLLIIIFGDFILRTYFGEKK